MNRERKRRKTVNEEIELKECREYFLRLLERVENRMMKRIEWRRWEEDREEKISKEEIRRVLASLRDGKPSGADGIPNEIWKYEGEKIEGWVWEYCNTVWRGEGHKDGKRD